MNEQNPVFYHISLSFDEIEFNLIVQAISTLYDGSELPTKEI